MYLLLATIGFLGLATLVGLGFIHHTGGDHGGTSHSVGSHGHGGHHMPLSTKIGNLGKGAKSIFPTSPLSIFSLALGAGAAGLLAASVSEPFRALIAIVGAVGFDNGAVKPMMGALGKFATRPSEGIEGLVAHGAFVETRFDALGRGLVRVTLDQEEVQLLAQLESAEVSAGVRVAKGDTVVVTSVDPRKNILTVTRELA